MKTKIFKHKLLTAGAIAALGLGFATGVQAAPEAYAVSKLEITNFAMTIENPAALPDLTQFTGNLVSATSCITDLALPDNIDGAVNGTAIPPIPATHDADAANCGSNNTVRTENVFNFVGAGVADYGSGDAYIPNTNIFGGGASSSIGESRTITPDLKDYTGDGRNTLAAEFDLLEATVISFAFGADYMAFAELFDNGLASQATSASSFILTVTQLNDPEVPTDDVVVLSFSPPALQVVAAVAVLPDTDGSLVVASGPFAAATPLLDPGFYKLEIQMESRATVKLNPPQVGGGDHYLCYKSFGHFLREEVNLIDQFDNVNFKVLKPKMFCNPAIKPVLDPEQGIENTDAHLLSYKINESHRQPRHERKTVIIRDQFGLLELETVNPDRLMVPSGKSLDDSDPTDQTGAINHFKCYRVRTLGGFQSIPVNVADQFTDPDLDLSDPLGVDPVGKDLVLLRPIRMCTPVSKNGEPIIEDPDANPEDPRDHLMCYAVRPGSGARLNKRTEVRSNNQFGLEDLVLKRELEFCAPASKTVLN